MQKWRLDVELVGRFPQVLKRPPLALDHHKHILEECGVTSGVSSLAFYLRLNRSFLFALETHGALPRGRDVIGSLCRSVDMTPRATDDIRGSVGGRVQSRTLADVRLAVFRRYLCLRLGCDARRAEVMVSRYPRNRHKSLRLTERILGLLHERGLSAEKIVRHPYLLNAHPDRLRALLENCPTVARIEIRDLLQRVPRIAYMPWHNPSWSSTGSRSPEEAVLNGAEVFTLAAETVRQRLAIIAEIPELWTMRHNKNSFKVLVSFQRVQGRLSYMRAINMRCLSVHLLSSFCPQFRRYVSAGEDRRGGCDMVTFLSRRLRLAPDAVGRQRQRRLLRVWTSVGFLVIFWSFEGPIKFTI